MMRYGHIQQNILIYIPIIRKKLKEKLIQVFIVYLCSFSTIKLRISLLMRREIIIKAIFEHYIQISLLIGSSSKCGEIEPNQSNLKYLND